VRAYAGIDSTDLLKRALRFRLGTRAEARFEFMQEPAEFADIKALDV
jgi:hypothetical protein